MENSQNATKALWQSGIYETRPGFRRNDEIATQM